MYNVVIEVYIDFEPLGNVSWKTLGKNTIIFYTYLLKINDLPMSNEKRCATIVFKFSLVGAC